MRSTGEGQEQSQLDAVRDDKQKTSKGKGEIQGFLHSASLEMTAIFLGIEEEQKDRQQQGREADPYGMTNKRASNGNGNGKDKDKDKGDGKGDGKDKDNRRFLRCAAE